MIRGFGAHGGARLTLIVHVDGAEAFRVPRYVVAFSLDAAADLIR